MFLKKIFNLKILQARFSPSIVSISCFRSIKTDPYSDPSRRPGRNAAFVLLARLSATKSLRTNAALRINQEKNIQPTAVDRSFSPLAVCKAQAWPSKKLKLYYDSISDKVRQE
uniref:Uncharacterized protein n=1 Tax=Acrobeloides nanus TaxID=290746 RepID=A0A914CHN1_9BILA